MPSGRHFAQQEHTARWLADRFHHLICRIWNREGPVDGELRLLLDDGWQVITDIFDGYDESIGDRFRTIGSLYEDYFEGANVVPLVKQQRDELGPLLKGIFAKSHE